MKRRRRAYHPPRRRTQTKSTQPVRARARSSAAAAAAPLSVNLLRTVVCGVLFVALVALKLLLPGGMAGVRGTLGTWLTRDADFAAAFSAVGRAVSGEGGVIDSLEDAYVAVFGDKEATEVSGGAEVRRGGEPAADTQDDTRDTAQDIAEPESAGSGTEPQEARDYPEHAVAEQRVLGFDYVSPLQGEVTSAFGWREHPTSGREAFHYGVDIGAEEGTEVACFADGMVGVVGESVELGKYLTVHHQSGVVTLYGHCSRIVVTSGAPVKRGEKLAEVGSTGNATGPHLHFEIHDGEDYINPVYYLS